MKRKLAGLFSAILLTLASQAHASIWDGFDDSVKPPREPGANSVDLNESIAIQASPETIWNILVDLDSYQDWNPWVTHAEGQIEVGAIVHVTAKINGKDFKAKHVVLTSNPYSDFCWRDAGWNASFVYGQRCRTLTVQDDGTTLVHVELLIDGALSGVAGLFQAPSLQDGIRKELEALKIRAEAAEGK